MIPLPAHARLLPDAEAVARAAADHVVEIAATAPHERIALCLSGGSTPKRLYELLAGPDYVERLPWGRLHLFLGDDRVVAPDDSRSNVHLVRAALGGADGDRIGPLPADQFHVIPMHEGAEAGARAYAATLAAYYGAADLDPGRPLFDLVLLGLGSDGHTASLFPGKPAVDETGAWTAPVPEAGLEPFVPRVSLTLPTLASCRSALFLVNGAGKREALTRLAAGEDLPAGRAGRLAGATWFIDREAADAPAED